MRERYVQHDYNISIDDDAQRVPDCDPLSSAQHRRWLKSLERVSPHRSTDRVNIDE